MSFFLLRTNTVSTLKLCVVEPHLPLGFLRFLFQEDTPSIIASFFEPALDKDLTLGIISPNHSDATDTPNFVLSSSNSNSSSSNSSGTSAARADDASLENDRAGEDVNVGGGGGDEDSAGIERRRRMSTLFRLLPSYDTAAKLLVRPVAMFFLAYVSQSKQEASLEPTVLEKLLMAVNNVLLVQEKIGYAEEEDEDDERYLTRRKQQVFVAL